MASALAHAPVTASADGAKVAKLRAATTPAINFFKVPPWLFKRRPAHADAEWGSARTLPTEQRKRDGRRSGRTCVHLNGDEIAPSSVAQAPRRDASS
jgi:hypothetical protein